MQQAQNHYWFNLVFWSKKMCIFSSLKNAIFLFWEKTINILFEVDDIFTYTEDCVAAGGTEARCDSIERFYINSMYEKVAESLGLSLAESQIQDGPVTMNNPSTGQATQEFTVLWTPTASSYGFSTSQDFYGSDSWQSRFYNLIMQIDYLTICQELGKAV